MRRCRKAESSRDHQPCASRFKMEFFADGIKVSLTVAIVRAIPGASEIDYALAGDVASNAHKVDPGRCTLENTRWRLFSTNAGRPVPFLGRFADFLLARQLSPARWRSKPEPERCRMKRMLILLALLGFGAGESFAATTATSEGQVGIGITASFGNVGFFYNSLRPYGEWIQFDAGFYGWRPMHVRANWRPYLYGRWMWTDYGWYWVSSEPFGWAVFHYGRWYYDDYYGWIWIPDRVWGPAWVEWRYNDDFLGWAPLPPYASFSFSIGIRFTTHWVAPYHYWNFVRYRNFTSPYVYRDVTPANYTRRLIGTTRSAGRYEVDGGRIINRGVDRQLVERRGSMRIERVNIRETSSRGDRIVREGTRGNVIEMYRPDRTELDRSPGRFDARRLDRGTSLDLQRIERPRGETAAPTDRGDVYRNSGVERATPVPRSDAPGFQQPNLDRQRIDRGFESPRPGTVERRREDRNPFPQREQMQRAPSRQETSRERSVRQERREVSPPRMRMETPRGEPRIKKESPRGSEPGRRDGGRRRG